MRHARHRRRSLGPASRRWVAIGSVLVVAGVVVGILLSGEAGGNRHSSHTREAATTSTAVAPTTTTTTTTPVAVGTYETTSTVVNLVEPVTAGESRSLPTTVWFPATTGTSGLVADRVHAPYPLLIFSQGFDSSVEAYQSLIEDWASAGFVVAAPTYPRTDPSDPAGVDENDIVNHPADLRFVISKLVVASQQPGSVLSGLLDPSEIGLVGHSDGGDVTLAVAADSCCQDSRVKAAAVLSGAELASFGGTYFTGPQVPLLVVQGTADTINPPGCSAQIYDSAAAPKYYLDLLGAGHAPPYVDAGTDQQVIAEVTTDFFDAELDGRSAGIAAMATQGDVAGASQLGDNTSAPVAAGSCPGAPG